jgi:hypothetical protein
MFQRHATDFDSTELTISKPRMRMLLEALLPRCPFEPFSQL